MTNAQTLVAEALGHWEQKLLRRAALEGGPSPAGLIIQHADAMLGAARDQLAYALVKLAASSSTSETPKDAA